MVKRARRQRTNEPPAVFSRCRAYRYLLWRRWDAGNPAYAMFIGLNPSTADEVNDDPTVRRCIRFAQRWGYGALCMTNIFAYRATDPNVMKTQADPVGKLNDRYLKSAAHQAGIVVAAWGTHGAHEDREEKVLGLLRGKLSCLGTTKAGHPRHPLYLRADTVPQPWA